MGELLRLLHAVRRSGVLGQIMDTMEVGEQPAGMSDATKRRKNDSEEFSSESEWDATVGQSSGLFFLQSRPLRGPVTRELPPLWFIT